MTVVDRLIGSAPFVCEGDPIFGIETAARLGYDGVELHFTDPVTADTDAIRAALHRTDRCVTALGTGRAYVNEHLSITDADESRRRAAVERLEQFVALAGRLQAKVIIGCMRGNLSRREELPSVLERLTISMRHLDKVAGDEGVEIVFEPINRYENNFLCTMAEISDFVRQNGLKHTGLLIDTFHMNIEEADLTASIRACASEIRYVHLADSNRRYPGRGHLNIAGVLAALRAIGYDGVLSAECLPLPSKEEAAAGWLTAVRELLKNQSEQGGIIHE